MQNKLPLMKLSPEEETFLRQWMYDETHFHERLGPAKRLQVQHQVTPVDLATLIAAAIPDPLEQIAGFASQPTEPAAWPWTPETFRARLNEAREVLAERARQRFRPPSQPEVGDG
jgi:hypothetical protein